MKSERIMKLMINHPCITTLLMSILAYPTYFAFTTAYAFIMPVMANMIEPYSYWHVTENWVGPIAAIALLPWIIRTIILMFAAKNPFGKFGTFFNKHNILIDNIIMYLPIAVLMDALYGSFLLPNHLALIIVITNMNMIGLAIKLIHKRRMFKKYGIKC